MHRALLITCLTASLAQDLPPAFRSQAELVSIPCTVVDSGGGRVAGFTKDDFRVYDNGVRRLIESFSVDADLPLTLGVLIDASSSQEQQLAEHRQTALELLRRILRPGNRAFVVSIAEEVRSWVDLTGDFAEIEGRMTQPPGPLFGQPCEKRRSSPDVKPISACGSSPLWNALSDAASLRMRSLTGSKALLILTDGFDSGSSFTWRQAVDQAVRADTAVYAVQYRSSGGRNFAPDLNRLVVDTGGGLFAPPEGDYQPVAARLETDLRRRYVLGVRPERLSRTSRHELRVEVDRPNVTVRARKAYVYDAP